MMYLLKGLLIGLLFGIPVGAVGTLTLERTINKNGISGFITGLGSTTADVIYACIGVFGITFISNFILKYTMIINIIGSILILTLGFKAFKNNKTLQTEKRNISLIKDYSTALIIGITNPASVLTFIFAFTYFGILEGVSIASGIFLILGIIIGTVIWWTILVFIGNVIKKKANDKITIKLNKIFGSILILFGISILIKTLL